MLTSEQLDIVAALPVTRTVRGAEMVEGKAVPFCEEYITISRADRDALVAMARDSIAARARARAWKCATKRYRDNALDAGKRARAYNRVAAAARAEVERCMEQLAAAESVHEFIADMADGSQWAGVQARKRYRDKWHPAALGAAK